MQRKRQSAVEDIFKDVDSNNDVVYTEEYSSSEEFLSSNYEEENASLSINNCSQLKNYKRDMSWEMEHDYFLLWISLYLMIVSDRSNLDNW